jgi:hypothetical protein
VRSWDVLQQALFAQHPGLHATELGAFDKMHDTAGNRTVAAKSASPTATDTVTLANITLFIAWSGQLVEYSVLQYQGAKNFLNGTAISERDNLVGVINENCNLRDYVFGDLRCIQHDLDLSSLLDPVLAYNRPKNGGLTKTHALLPGSPAINHVICVPFEDRPETDQRGRRRPAGPTCDVGAYEANAVIPPP